jgi:YD repeat-containing protein
VNPFGGLLEWVDALGRKTTYQRNADSQVTSRIGPDGVEFLWVYLEDLGVLWWTNDVSSDSTVVYEYPLTLPGYVYCTNGGYPCLVEREGRVRGPGLGTDVTEFEYVGNRVRKVVHPGGDSTVYQYGGAYGQVSKITTPLGRKQRFEYDGSTGRLLRSFKYKTDLIRFGDTTFVFPTDSTNYFYDGKGRVRRVTEDPTSGSYPYGKAYTETEYDPIGRVMKSTRVRADTTPQIQHSVTYAYDDTNRKLTVTDPKSQSQLFTFDALGRTTRRDDPAGAYETFVYDANGNLESWRTRRGDTITYSYDALDRILSKAVPGVGTTTYGYDTLRGTLDTIVTPSVRNYREFDARGRITRDSSWVSGLSGDGYAIRYTYDYQGNLKTLIDHTGAVWTYEPRANPVPFGIGFRYSAQRWEDFQYDTTEWTYDEDGRLSEIAYHNGVRDTLQYNLAGQLTRWQAATYARLARGGRISQMDAAEPGGNRRVKYKYDFRGQLIEEWDSIPGQTPVVRTYTYDAAGNRTGSGYRYDSANRLLATSADTFTYDAPGNLTWWKEKSTGEYRTFTWDAEDVLTTVKLYHSGGGSPYRTVSFTYDGSGRRVKKVVTGDQTDTVRYVWDGSEVLAEIGPGRRYTPHPTNVDATLSVSDTEAGGTFYFQFGAAGSVREITNASGSTVSQYRYDAFGNRSVIGNEGYTSPIGWQGREYDAETELYYFRARYFVPGLGR